MVQLTCFRHMRNLTTIAIPLLLLAVACEAPAPRDRADRPGARQAVDEATYQAEVEEGLGAAGAILIDTSGSMRDRIAGDGRRSEERRVGKEGRSRWSPYH